MQRVILALEHLATAILHGSNHGEDILALWGGRELSYCLEALKAGYGHRENAINIGNIFIDNDSWLVSHS